MRERGARSERAGDMQALQFPIAVPLIWVVGTGLLAALLRHTPNGAAITLLISLNVIVTNLTIFWCADRWAVDRHHRAK